MDFSCNTSKEKKISVRRINVSWETDWVKLTVMKHYGSLIVAPNKTRPAVIERSASQRNFGIHSVVQERSGSPRSDQSTTRDKDKIFQFPDAKFLVLCPGKPNNHIISDVVLERFRADDVFATAPVGERQKCSTTLALTRDTFGSVRKYHISEIE